MDNSLTTNRGTISATTANGYGIWYENDGSSRVNNILINFGTISAIAGTTSDGIGLGKSAQGMFNTTINNSGTISGSDNSILVLNSSSTGIDIVTKGDGTFEINDIGANIGYRKGKVYFNISEQKLYRLGADGKTFTEVDIADFEG